MSQIQCEEIWSKHFAFPCYVFVTSSGLYFIHDKYQCPCFWSPHLTLNVECLWLKTQMAAILKEMLAHYRLMLAPSRCPALYTGHLLRLSAAVRSRDKAYTCHSFLFSIWHCHVENQKNDIRICSQTQKRDTDPNPDTLFSVKRASYGYNCWTEMSQTENTIKPTCLSSMS